MYIKLKIEAKRSQRPATELARTAIEQWLHQQEKEAIHQAITQYAQKYAGTLQDLDPQLEAATIEFLTTSTQEKRKK